MSDAELSPFRPYPRMEHWVHSKAWRNEWNFEITSAHLTREESSQYCERLAIAIPRSAKIKRKHRHRGFGRSLMVREGRTTVECYLDF
jgi:hypothetical protein